ncbi:MAG TPA: hypothetical protein VMB82_14120, partial [Acidimicrobiales bacterium]|nr:hypothetical protein [Acidimicrobiales bacterium]
MPDTLAAQLRALVEVAPPVTVPEIVARPASPPGAVRRPHRPGRRRSAVPAAVAATVLVASGAVAWALGAAPWSARPGPARRPPQAPVVLTGAALAAIATTSTAASASSGTAVVHDVTTQNGATQSDDTVAVTFTGADIDERITVAPEPPGSGAAFTTDDRLVGGQFYIYTPGPGDVPEWLHDVGGDSTASMAFPDPRTLYAALRPEARFVVVGTASVDGSTWSHLDTLDPGAIPASALGSLAQGTLTSFSLWVDGTGVVRAMTLTSAQTARGCTLAIGAGHLGAVRAALATGGKGSTVEVAGRERVRVLAPGAVQAASGDGGVAASCGPQTTASLVTVAFAHLGAPETVVAPAGA